MIGYPKIKTLHSKAYKAFIRLKPCERCKLEFKSQAHHESALSSKNGIGMKVSDEYCLPLCWHCHNLRHSYGAKTFWGNRLKELPELCKKYVAEFKQLGGKF